MRAPHVEPSQAATFLQLVDHAVSLVGEQQGLAYLRGWLGARQAEPVSARAALHEAERFLARHSTPPPASNPPPPSEGGPPLGPVHGRR